jgi:alkanesulfonate monooxygenase SsuD/methylene tetrahydromethanopterin reductase-like flavin-dependent oxidoreductase (luciferase family)
MTGEQQTNQGIVIQGSTVSGGQFVAGRYARAFQTINAAEEALSEKGQNDIRARLDELKQALAAYGSSLPNADEVVGATEQVAQQLGHNEPNKISIQGILTGIAGSVQSVATIATAVEALQRAVGLGL